MRRSPTLSQSWPVPLGPLLAGLCLCALLGCGQKAAAPAAKTPGPAAATAKKQTGTEDAQSKTNAPTNGVAIPKSVFVTNSPSGKDPFYPESPRRSPEPSKPDGPKDNGPTQPPGAADFTLFSITGSEMERMAIVNDAILEAGKPAEITVKKGGQSQKIKVRCLRITATSVTFTVQGQTNPIELRAP